MFEDHVDMICLSIACSMSEKIHIERKNPSVQHCTCVSGKLVYLVIWYTNYSGVLVFWFSLIYVFIVSLRAHICVY